VTGLLFSIQVLGPSKNFLPSRRWPSRHCHTDPSQFCRDRLPFAKESPFHVSPESWASSVPTETALKLIDAWNEAANFHLSQGSNRLTSRYVSHKLKKKHPGSVKHWQRKISPKSSQPGPGTHQCLKGCHNQIRIPASLAASFHAWLREPTMGRSAYKPEQDAKSPFAPLMQHSLFST